MNNLLDFAGLLLYYIVLPLLFPLQVMLYVLAGLWFTFIFCHRMALEIPRWAGWMRTASRAAVGKVQVAQWRRKLVKVPA